MYDMDDKTGYSNNIDDLKYIYEVALKYDCFMDCPVKFKQVDLSALEFFLKINGFASVIIEDSLFISETGDAFLDTYGTPSSMKNDEVRKSIFHLMMTTDLIESFNGRNINIYIPNKGHINAIKADLVNIRQYEFHIGHTVGLYENFYPPSYYSKGGSYWKIYDYLYL